jgi:2-polyprenyl-3-methyl-5-hydroxy-6-metoxy-1,4-benzoquinol methylase
MTYDANASFWVQIIREQRDKYRTGLTNSAVLDAVGPAKGLRILDAGCGEGYLSRFLAEGGAEVTGIDSSNELVKAARDYAPSKELPVSFDVGSVDSLPYNSKEFDIVVCNHLMNDLQDPSIAIEEFSRVLRDGGRVVIMMLHPCFYNKHAERGNPENNLITDTYFQARPVTQHFEVDGIKSPASTTSWLRPLEFYTEALRESGFVITSLTEPHPSPEMMQADDWWRTSFMRPLFMLLTAQRWVALVKTDDSDGVAHL